MGDKVSRSDNWGPGMMERVARKKLGNPDNFKFYGYKFISEAHDVMMTGCVTTKIVEKGERKGEPAYEGVPRSVVVTRLEIEQESKDYESETGKCSACLGDGLEFYKWTVKEGASYRSCQRCSGKGTPCGEKENAVSPTPNAVSHTPGVRVLSVEVVE